MSRGFEVFDTYRRYILEGNLVNIAANTLTTEEGKLVVLRKSTRFDEDEERKREGWIWLSTGVGKDLAQFTLGFGVHP